MTDRKEELKPRLKEYVETVTTKSKGNLYICPLCNSGTGKHKSGAFGIYENGTKWKCQACGRQGDIFDLAGAIENLDTLPEQIRKLEEIFGLSHERTTSEQRKINTFTKSEPMKTAIEEIPEAVSYSRYFEECHARLHESDYHTRRGISDETAERFNLGYDFNWKHPKAPEYTPTSPRLIIPISEHTYLARDIREHIPETEEEYKKSKVKGTETPIWTFNRQAIENPSKPVFIVEGELDAMSIEQAGGIAVALGSINGVYGFLSLLEGKRIDQPIIISLDNEDNPNIEKAITTLEAGLDEAGLLHTRAEGNPQYKDANEMLVADEKGLAKMIRENERNAEALAGAKAIEIRDNYIKANSVYFDVPNFINGVFDNANTPPTPTGFKKLDEVLEGGIREGLIFIGALSSLGKTTFACQLIDQIARHQKKDALIISLEMSKYQLMAKSISRETLIYTKEAGKSSELAKSNLGITDGTRYEKYSKEEHFVIENAQSRYCDFAEHLFIKEGQGDIGTAQIRKWIEEHIRVTGNTPIVLVDYLQIMAPPKERMTDKQVIDYNVMELKRISRDFKTPVIAISSINRSNYLTPIDFESFKESGAIEFSADIVIGLQLACLEEPIFNSGTQTKIQEKRERINQAKADMPRKIQAVILKNRNGQTGDKINYAYYQKYNLFEEGKRG